MMQMMAWVKSNDAVITTYLNYLWDIFVVRELEQRHDDFTEVPDDHENMLSKPNKESRTIKKDQRNPKEPLMICLRMA